MTLDEEVEAAIAAMDARNGGKPQLLNTKYGTLTMEQICQLSTGLSREQFDNFWRVEKCAKTEKNAKAQCENLGQKS